MMLIRLKFWLLNRQSLKDSTGISMVVIFDIFTDNNPLTYILTTAKLDATG